MPTTAGEHVFTKLFPAAPEITSADDTVNQQQPWDVTLQRMRGDVFIDTAGVAPSAARMVIFGSPMPRDYYDAIGTGSPKIAPSDPDDNSDGDDFPLWLPVACVDTASRINPGQLTIDSKAKRKLTIGNVIGCFIKSTTISATRLGINFGVLVRCLWSLRK